MTGKIEGTRTVLVVDDDPSVCRALERHLRSAGFEVKTFDAPEALLASDLPRGAVCMVLDIRMPGMSGFELLDALVARGHDIPPVFITGHDSEEIRGQAQAYGAVDILYKPFEDASLLAAIGRALERGRAERGS